MTSTGREAAPLPSGCTIYDHRYFGPIPGYDFNAFSIYAVFDAGSQKYFSGIRVVVVCKAGVQEYENLDVSEAGDDSSISIKPSPSSGLSKDDDQPPNQPTEKPLCTMVYEITDKSNDMQHETDICFRPNVRFDDPTFRTLYLHTERPPVPGHHTSVMLFLMCSKSFRSYPKPASGIVCAYPAATGITAFGARILPPPFIHPPFKQPPPEVLDLIFRDVVHGDTWFAQTWRTTVISLALVCRAWSRAMTLLYEEFSLFSAAYKPRNTRALAHALEEHPDRGQAIRTLSPEHFIRHDSPASYEQVSRAFVKILQTASLVVDLAVSDLHVDQVDSLKQALCNCSAVQSFTISSPPPHKGCEGITHKISMGDILECVSHWPQLRSLAIYGIGKTEIAVTWDNAAVNTLRPISCQLEVLYLQDGPILDHELLRLTSSSTSLQTAVLSSLTGLTNAGLRTWLVAVGQSLGMLTLEKLALSRETDDEEWAIDSAIAHMPHLCNLKLDGAFFSERVFMREAVGEYSHWWEITLQNVPKVMLGENFLAVLKHCGWRDIHMWGAFDHDHDLGKAAEKVASEHGLNLYI